MSLHMMIPALATGLLRSSKHNTRLVLWVLPVMLPRAVRSEPPPRVCLRSRLAVSPDELQPAALSLAVQQVRHGASPASSGTQEVSKR